MKIYTDVGNFQTVKLLAAAATAGVDVEVVVTINAKVVPYLTCNKLPVLEPECGEFIFSPNAATRYLLSLGKKIVDEAVEKRWAEWESSQLLPVVVPLLVSAVGQGKQDKTQEKTLQPLLKYLEAKLKGKKFLVGSRVSSADIIVFGTLFPVLLGNLAKDSVKECPSIQAWGQTVADLTQVEGALRQVTEGGNVQSLKASLLAQPVPPPANIDTAKLYKGMQGHTAEGAQQAAKSAAPVDEFQFLQPEKTITAEELATGEKSFLSGASTSPKPRLRKHPILPCEGEKNIFITSALPYVNNVPHLGNIIGCVLSGDVFSRFCRLRNRNVLYVCGTDEYGTATETKAMEEGLTPQQICDKYNKLHSEIYQWLNIDFDYFGRTTTKEQTEIAQDIFWKLYNQGFILKDSVDQLQCQKCVRFLADRFVEGTCPLCGYDDARGDQCDGCGKLINAVELKKPKCKICSSTPVIKTSQHLFLDLPKVEPQLRQHLDRVFETGTWTHNAQVITSSWIRDGLKPRCISRDLKWGTPVPLEGYTDKVFYVWFDAPIGYISITANYTKEWKKWWKNPDKVEMYNFLGKDNVPFHSVIFPCTLLGADDNYTIVNSMLATEYLNYEDGKFSKSRGVGVFGDQARDTGIAPDVYRFYLLYVRPESQDSAFSWDDFLLKNNSELLNNIGNFINRALMFVSNCFEGTIQDMNLSLEDKKLIALVNRELATYVDNMESVRIRDSIRNILSISRLGNQYMQANKPWVLAKGTPQERARSGCVVSLSANIACQLSVLLQPYLPVTSGIIQEQLNAPADCNIIVSNFTCQLKSGHKIGKPSPLFQKIEASKIEELKQRFAGAQPKPASAASLEEIERLTQEVAKQGNEVRELKGQKAEKALIEAAVNKLLDLKKQLTKAQGGEPPAAGKKKGKQGKGDAKSTPAPAVTPTPATPTPATPSGDQGEIDRLTEQVSAQGTVVRELKTKKGDKAAIDAAVAQLLDLKRQLAVAQGLDPDQTIGGGKKKGKKK
ncbi:methionine--tRNA ligase, cytoplasmic-like [Haliotis rufescens]|uniref:methionine--tRNA ligase, cytoplasmic-like n=1 Tax=Haliotis rufescens TaxID=6454 RepID=UPI00201F689F|nr:methionine--tRNA ligase, cytoplasmic-like [Haliotis rufescens]